MSLLHVDLVEGTTLSRHLNSKTISHVSKQANHTSSLFKDFRDQENADKNN